MRITDRDMSNDSFSATAASAKARTAAVSSTESAAQLSTAATLTDDSAHISAAASLVSHTMALPEVNSARVSDVQLALASGHFQVDNSRVASALIRTMLDGAWS